MLYLQAEEAWGVIVFVVSKKPNAMLMNRAPCVRNSRKIHADFVVYFPIQRIHLIHNNYSPNWTVKLCIKQCWLHSFLQDIFIIINPWILSSHKRNVFSSRKQCTQDHYIYIRLDHVHRCAFFSPGPKFLWWAHWQCKESCHLHKL